MNYLATSGNDLQKY